MEAPLKQPNGSEAPLQLLLFVDKRPSSREKIRQIRQRLKELDDEPLCHLQIIDVGEQPHLVEHFKLVATPALVKIHPEPRQVLAGSNLIAQIDNWWSRWRQAAEDFVSLERSHSADRKDDNTTAATDPASAGYITYSAELLRLSDEIFRLNQEKESLKEQLQFKDRLIAMLAHDLRNPLTAVSIALETLELGNATKDKTPHPRLTPETMGQLLKHARTQAKAIDRMITDVLQVAKGTAGTLQILPQKLALDQLCMEVISDLKGQYQAKAQQIETDIPSDLPEVYADPERVRQVLVNLLDNAIKYTPQGGTIQVSVLHRTTQKVQISICDNGPGIPPENRERIFEDRFRLERDEGKEGYGIGLALCQRIVRAHYGQIWVDSSVDRRGSCFHFTLPVYPTVR